MKIAVTYENGTIFQHFGRTENFRIYDVEDGAVVSSEVMNAGGVGHEALAELLAQHDISVLICGGMGAGAQAALAEAGIEVYAGAEGSADEAVEKYLKGELESTGVNCDHHSHGEDHDHGCGEGGCGSGGCSSCSGCGGSMIEGKNVGRTCRVHYRGTFDDGTQFDSSYDRGEPLEFVCGAGMMIRGFDSAVAQMDPGEIVDVHLMPEEAYGPVDPRAVFSVVIRELPGSEGLEVGQKAYLTNDYGQPFIVRVVAKDDTLITFDANHEMAGKKLNFRIELVEVL
ncbi:MAG: peptidylprolyl isomerase [Lachnospiraceae bacterium]|nr:peptidylprolyl isomerase [Lachnospiraceae bacterium]